MFIEKLKKNLFICEKTCSYFSYSLLSMKRKKEIQLTLFRKLLNFAWNNSPFYKKYYLAHGIKETDLPNITISDLPFTDKTLLMENFDSVISDPNINKKKVHDFINPSQNPTNLLNNKYYVTYTSGTSGEQGIFLHDKKTVYMMHAQFNLDFTLNLAFKLKRKIRMCYLGLNNLQRAFSTLSATSDDYFFMNVKFVSTAVSDSKLCQNLNEFKPDILIGYPSCFDKINYIFKSLPSCKNMITPSMIMLCGESFSSDMIADFKSIWPNSKISNIYGSSEGLIIGNQKDVFSTCFNISDNLVNVEILKGNQVVKNNDAGEIVITSFHNRIMPIIRYKTCDEVKAFSKEKCISNNSKQIGLLSKRQSIKLPILTYDDRIHYFSELEMRGFYVEGVKKIQFVCKKLGEITIYYVGEQYLKNKICVEFKKLLALKQAEKNTSFAVEQVNVIQPSVNTGKFNFLTVYKNVINKVALIENINKPKKNG